MLFMVIEHFRDRRAPEVYQRFRERGRLAPDGLRYVDSWVEVGFGRRYQVMECDEPRLLAEWIANWQDIVEFEVVPVLTPREAAAAIEPRLPRSPSHRP
jgi:hypothetical protein